MALYVKLTEGKLNTEIFGSHLVSLGYEFQRKIGDHFDIFSRNGISVGIRSKDIQLNGLAVIDFQHQRTGSRYYPILQEFFRNVIPLQITGDVLGYDYLHYFRD